MKKQVLSHEHLIQICTLGAVLAFGSPAYAQESWDLAGDWNPPANPNGAWTYGDYDSGSFVDLSYITNGTGGAGGYFPVSRGSTDGFIYKNLTGSAAFGIGPGQVSLESNYGTAVARWTAPNSGFYDISVLIGGTTASEGGGYGNHFAQYGGLNINMVGQTADSFINNVMSWTFTNMLLSAGTTVDAYVAYPGFANGGDTETMFHVDAVQTPTNLVVINVIANYSPLVPATTNFILAFQFDRPMNTNVAPVVVLTNSAAGALQPQIPATGAYWASVSGTNNTYYLPPITITQGMNGTNEVFISGAQDIFGDVLPLTNVAAIVVDATPPVISNVSAAPGLLQCTITWLTDKPAYDEIAYGTTASYGASTPLSGQLATSHSVTLTGLNPSTLYHFNLTVVDRAGNVAVSGDSTFATIADTFPPSAFFTGGPSENSTACALPITFSWSGSDLVTAATNLVFAYELDGAAYSAFSSPTNLPISSLADGTHTIYVEARDQAGNVSAPASVTFTLQTSPPSLSSLADSPGPNYAIVTWRTSTATTSSVDYGLTTAYGQSVSSSQLVNNHSVTIPGLQAVTTYHFSVTSQDDCGRSVVSSDVQFTTLPAPDLQVRSVSAPAQVYTGSGFNVSWMDTNAGQGVAYGPWVDAVYLSHTNGLNTNTDQLLGLFPFLDRLGPGQAVQLIQSVTINRAGLTNGNYYVSVYTDATNAVFEGSFKSNNVGVSASTIAVQLTPLPALAVTQITAPTNALGGQTIEVTWTVCNQGAGDTDVPLWYDHLYLSSTTNLTGVVADYGTYANPSYLLAGDCYDQVATVALPVGIGGANYFIVTADSTGLVAAADATNNTVDPQPISIQEVLPGFLHVVSVQVSPAPPTTVWAGQAVTATWTVENTGQSAITGTWDDELTLSPTPVYDFVHGYWDVLNHIYFTGPLAPGQTYSHTGTFAIPERITPGNWYAVPTVDTHFFAGGTGAIGSGDIGRDQNSTLVLVAPPIPADLDVTSVSAPTTAALGASITVGWSVTNIGLNQTSADSWYDSVYLSPVTPFDASQSTNVGSFAHLGALDIGQGYTNSQNVTVPADYLPTNSPSATNYLYVLADSGGVVIELTTTNHVLAAPQPIVISQAPPVLPADLTVTSVTIPSLVVAGTTASVSWSVTNQGAGTTSVSNWVDSVYLSPTTTFNPAVATHMADIPHDGALAPGGGYVANQALSLPYCAIGFFYVVVVADSGQQVYEGGARTNSTLSSPEQLWIYPSMAAELQVSAVNPAASVQAGSPLAVSWTVQNLANPTTNAPWLDAVYLSPVPKFSPASSYLLGIYPQVANLGSRSSYTATQSPVVPRCLSGTYYVAVVTDLSNSVDAISCYTNNVLTASSSTVILPSSYPSLQVTGLSLPPGVNAGSPWTIQWTVKNAGTGAASGVWDDAVYASLLPTLDTNAMLLAQFGYNNGLASSDSYTQSESVSFPPCMAGSYYIYVVTDVSNVVNGAACRFNNQIVSQAPLVVNFGLYPDLVVTGVTSPATALAGQTMTVSWSVTNSGAATATGPWVDSVYLFSSAVFSPSNSVFLGSYPRTQSLAPGGGYSQTVSPTLPDSTHGTYTVAVVTDSSNTVQECMNQNNKVGFGAASVTVPVTLYPDLKVTSVQVPASAYAGQNITVTWIVTNDGTATTGATPWTDAIYLSLDQVLDPSDIRLGSLGSPRGLAPGQNYTNSTTVTLPPGDSGPYYILVLADSAGVLFEHLGYNDSLGWNENPMILALPAPADLAATSVTVAPNSGVPGTSITVKWNVSNLSSNSIPSVWTDAIYLSTNSVFDVNAVLIASDNHSGLTGGGAYADSFTGPLPAMTPGTYHAIARTDVRDTLDEPNLANNTVVSAGTISVDVPTLALGQPVTNQIATGGAQYYKFSAAAGQTVSVTLLGSSPASQNELYVRYGAVPDLGDYDFLYSNPFSPNQAVSIPTTQSGFYYVMVRGGNEPGGPLAYTLEAVIVPFGIASVSPANMGDNGQVTITLAGAKFQPGAAVSLVAGTNTYQAQTNIFVSATTVQGRFLFTNATDGTYDVVLTNPDGTVARLSQGVAIEPATAPTAAAFNGSVNLETRRGLPFRWNGYVQNVGNVDIPYLSVAMVTDPTYPVLLSAPVGSLVPDPNTPVFLYQNLPPGQPLNFSFVVSNASSLGVTYYVLPTASSREGFLAQISNEAESIREYILMTANGLVYTTTNTLGVVTTNIGTLPPDVVTALSESNLWVTYFAQGLVTIGILDAADLGSLPPPTSHGLLTGFSRALATKDAAGCKGCEAALEDCLASVAAAYLACLATTGIPSLGTSVPICTGGAAIAIAACLGASFSCGNRECGPPPPTPCGTSQNGDPASGIECKPAPKDPNEKQGPLGFGDPAFVGFQQPWLYTVYFANETNAQAYARQVTITDPLDAGLDIRTFRVTEIAFGGVEIIVPTNQSFYQTRVPAPAPNTTNVVIDISAGVNVQSNSVFCTFNAIDLNTGELVTSVNQGVLPPDLVPPNGEGHLVYTIKPLAGTATGRVITNQASIVFDTNDPLDTNTTTNTVDGVAPTSFMTALPTAETDTNFVVSWSGTDDVGGSGIQNYDIYVSDNGSQYVPFLLATTANNATFNGVPAHTYAFYSLARDNAGNVEAVPSAAKAFTYVSTNQPPVLTTISNQVVSVGIGNGTTITNYALNPNGGASGLQFGLVNAPPGLSINPTNGSITFVPTPAQGGTTNLVTIVVTNNGVPPLSTTESFLIIVPDYGQLTLGSGAVSVGQAACVPVTLFTTTGLTNVSFTVTAPTNHFTGLTFTPVAPAIGSWHLTLINSSNALVTVAAAPGLTLNGTEELGNICFTALSNQLTALAPLHLSSPAATKADGTPLADIVAGSGQIIVLVGARPYLEVVTSPNNLVQLTLYGALGTTDTLETSLSVQGPWSPAGTLSFTNLSQTMTWTNQGENTRFFRLIQH